ncbi:MAG: thiamine phosphate synthase [Pirellulales bacterium]
MPLSAELLPAARIVDANLNRASEGLRVIEDYARFALGDAFLAETTKQIRHRLTAATSSLTAADRLVARDTQGDVGTQITTPQEFVRTSARQVAAASSARLAQALRTIEEYGKLLFPANAVAEIEALRYLTYTLEKAYQNLAQAKERLSSCRLYVLIDTCVSEADFIAQVRAIVTSGANCLQLRDKQANDRTLVQRGKLLRSLLQEYPESRTLFVMNDRPDLALLTRADGVHVGQEELTVSEVRQVVGSEMLVGVSTHNLVQAKQAILDGASYIGCGPTFPSQTKSFEEFPGLNFLKQVASELAIPAFAIGGIDESNLPQVLATGFTRVAVSSAITRAPSPATATCTLAKMLANN